MGSVKTISIIIAANIKGLEKGLGKANKSLANFASGAARTGSLLSFGVTAPLTAFGKSAFDAFSNFENGMLKVRAVTSASVGDFKMLTAEAKRLGSTTQFTAQQVADLQLVLGRKGFDPTQIQGMEKSILDLALATGEDLSLAAEVVASSINAFSMEASDASSIANTLASAAANSSIQLSTFATAFGHAGASANAVGMEIEELAAMMGVLMDNGIKASKAGTGLRKIFMKLHRDGIKFSDVLDLATQGELGLEKAMKLAGVTAAGQLLILAKNKKKVAELTEEYKTNTTRLDAMTELMGSGAKAKVALMTSAIEGLKIELGALVYDAVLPIIQYITELAGEFASLEKGTKKMIITFAGVAAVIGPILLGLGALLSVMTPIGLAIVGVVTGLVALTAATVDSNSALDDENDALNVLASRAMSANSSTEKRKNLIEELNTKYPSFLKNLGDEKVSNEDIKKALDGANTAFIKKIKLQGESKKLQELQNAQSAAASDLVDSEADAILTLNDLYKDSNLTMGTYHSTTEKLSRALEDMKGGYEQLDSKTTIWLGTLGDKRVDSSRGEIVDLNKEVDSNQVAFDEAKKAVDDYMLALESIGSKAVLPKPEKVITPESIEPLTPTGGWFDLTESELSQPWNDLEESWISQSNSLSTDIELNLPTEDVETFGEKVEGVMGGIAGKIGEFMDTWGAGINQVGEIFSQNIQNKSIALDNEAALEEARINKSSMSEEQKEDALQVLHDETAKKQLVLKRKQAKADKAMSIFNLIAATAEAVMKAAPNPFAMAAMGVLGAAQMAMVSSQPLPAFAEGGLVTGATMGLVGEGRGTTMSNPEVIAPLDKLQGMLGDSGQQSYIPNLTISGDDLLVVFDRATRRKDRR